MDHCFVSPLGRAQETASYCMKAVGMNAKTLDWLEEFDAPVDLNRTPELLAAYPNVKPEPPAGTPVKPSTESEAKGFPRGDTPGKGESLTPGMYRLRRPWDIGQIYYAEHPELMDPFGWRSSEIYLKSEMPTRYDQVVNAFNELLASYGYVHENGLYRVEKESRETLAFFCHLGVTCVLLSALWKTSPFFLWQNLAMPTSSVTELFTEEREPGAALFRALQDVDLCIACGPFQVRIVVREHAHFGHVLSGNDVFDKMTLLIETASRDPSDHSGAGQDHDRADI